MTGQGRTRVSYIVSRWGEPTQTFVRREAEAVESAGFAVETISIKRPGPLDGGRSAQWLSPAQVFLSSVRAAFRAPVRSAAILGTILFRSSPRNLVPHIGAAMVGMAWFARRTIRDGAVHAHFGWTNATAVWAWSRLSSREFDVVLHAFELHTTSHLDRFTAVPLRDAVQVFTISARDRDLVRERWDIDAAILRMGLPGSVRTESPRSVHHRRTGAIVSVGSLLPKKGHDILLRAVAQLDPPWHLTIVGSGEQEEELRALVRHLDLADRARFAGRLDQAEILDLLDSAWCVALACVETGNGDRDGIPVALMEAMGRGTPVVSTDAGAIDELLEGAGIIVPQRDAAALAAAISSLADHDRWQQVANAGFARIRDEFSASQAMASLAPTLDAMSAESPRTSGINAR